MMKKPFFLLLLAVFTGQSFSFAQVQAAKPALLSPLLAAYDLHYVKLDIAMNNTSTQVAGKATLKARVTAASLSQFAFELDSMLAIDSVRVQGDLLPVVRSGSLVTTTLTMPAAAGQNITAEIYYHGATPGGTTFFTRGLVVDPAFYGHSITFSLSDRFLAKDWWPCKQDITDKIDSADLWITVPDSVQVASNGLLKNVTDVAPGFKRYEWSTRYPTAYYLLSVAIMPYQTYQHMAYFDADSMPVVHYIPDAPGLLDAMQPQLDSLSLVLSYFSELFGRYPFWQEKYGQALAPLGGGMEHQTMTTIGPFGMDVMAHELCHQWWGDAVTFGSWADIWLSEGFASYGEHLFYEHFYTAADTKSWRLSSFNGVVTQPGGSVFVDDTTNDYRVFDGRLTYLKGGAVAHMLRHRINNDTLFFQGLRDYLAAHAYENALTADLQSAMEAAAGLNLDTFFNQWIYGEGYPRYSIKWNQADGVVYLELTQTASKPSSISLFHTPVEILLKSAAGDTTVRLYNNEPVQLYAISWDKSMSGLQLDPDKHLLCRQLTVQHQPELHVSRQATGHLQLLENPARTAWRLSGLESPASLTVYDLAGTRLQQLHAQGSVATIAAAHLKPGTYLLQVRQQGRHPVYYRLIKL